MVRAPLFVPATRPERFTKAATSGADAVILDLEDAVAPGEKDHARALIQTEISAPRLWLRVNGIGTPWHEADIAAAKSTMLDAVILPKAEKPDEVADIVESLGLPVILLIETALGLANVRELAQVAGVGRLAFGSVDFCVDLGMAHQQELLLPARFEIVLASRLAGLTAPLDGVTTDLRGGEQIISDARHASDLGFSGKLCIHPAQIASVRDAFRPSAADLLWAKQVLTAEGGAVQVNGAMVDEPIRLRARSIIENAAE